MSKIQDLIPPDVQEKIDEMRIKSAQKEEKFLIRGKSAYFNASTRRLQLFEGEFSTDEILGAFRAKTRWDWLYPEFRLVFTQDLPTASKGTTLQPEGILVVPPTGVVLMATMDKEVE